MYHDADELQVAGNCDGSDDDDGDIAGDSKRGHDEANYDGAVDNISDFHTAAAVVMLAMPVRAKRMPM